MRNSPSSQSTLLEEIERYLERKGLSATAFGEEVMNDRHLVKRLRAGGSVTLRTADKIRAFIRDGKRRPSKRQELQPTG